MNELKWKATDYEAKKGCLTLSVWPAFDGFCWGVEFKGKMIHQGGPEKTLQVSKEKVDAETEPGPKRPSL